MPRRPLRALAPLRPIAGLALTGYGMLVVLQVLPHDALVAGVASLVLGVALLATVLPSLQLPGLPGRTQGRGRLVAGLGAVAAGGVGLYNLALGSDLSPPELGLLVYGLALLAASRCLDARIGPLPVATAVGWSFPLLLAPLLLYAVHAVLSGPAGLQAGSAAAPLITHGLVTPMAAGLSLLGTPSHVVSNNVILSTPRGPLALGVGLVCAGLYPMVLFLGVLGLHAWQEQLSPRRFVAYLAAGLGGLWAANLLRLVVLAKVGEAWGGESLQTAHAHLGWALFAGFMVLFWAVALRRIESPSRPAPPAPPP